MIWFEIETDWWNGLYKIARYSFANRRRKRGCGISDLIFVIEADWMMDTVKCELREWLNEMEKVEKFKIRWFIVFRDEEELYEL